MSLKSLVKLGNVKKLKWHEYTTDEKYLNGGIYRMYNFSDEVIYVGKSVDLNKRLSDHLGLRTNTADFMVEVARIEYLQEPDPVYLTLLEGIFIAYHKPKYNDEVEKAKQKFGEMYGKQ